LFLAIGVAEFVWLAAVLWPSAPQQITPEEARAALLKLKSLRVITGGEDDPIYVDLKTGAIAWIDESTIDIGKFISCNLKENTWRMGVGNPAMRFAAHAEGRFERGAFGTWRAIQAKSPCLNRLWRHVSNVPVHGWAR
jgi:hypothetical protein